MTRAERDELEGFAEGIRFALGRSRREGTPLEELERSLRDADQLLRSGKLGGARSVLLRIDQELRSRRTESEMTDRPRGLVSYQTIGPRGDPPTADEDQVANRLLLVQRLVQLRQHQGHDVRTLLPTLNEAETAYRAGDRARCRRLTDEAHDALEGMDRARAEED